MRPAATNAALSPFAVLALLVFLAGVAGQAPDAGAQRNPDIRKEACALVLPGMDKARVREGLSYKQADGTARA
ncbi:MAG: hypothetical protein ACREOU_10730 [Candidatus Eiseniibacteriota bacterium]